MTKSRTGFRAFLLPFVMMLFPLFNTGCDESDNSVDDDQPVNPFPNTQWFLSIRYNQPETYEEMQMTDSFYTHWRQTDLATCATKTEGAYRVNNDKVFFKSGNDSVIATFMYDENNYVVRLIYDQNGTTITEDWAKTYFDPGTIPVCP